MELPEDTWKYLITYTDVVIFVATTAACISTMQSTFLTTLLDNHCVILVHLDGSSFNTFIVVIIMQSAAHAIAAHEAAVTFPVFHRKPPKTATLLL